MLQSVVLLVWALLYWPSVAVSLLLMKALMDSFMVFLFLFCLGVVWSIGLIAFAGFYQDALNND